MSLIYLLVGLAILCSFIGITLILGYIPVESQDEAADILAEQMELDRLAMSAADRRDRDTIAAIEERRKLLDQCTEKVRPDKNDSTRRWKKGGEGRYRECEQV